MGAKIIFNQPFSAFSTVTAAFFLIMPIIVAFVLGDFTTQHVFPLIHPFNSAEKAEMAINTINIVMEKHFIYDIFLSPFFAVRIYFLSIFIEAQSPRISREHMGKLACLRAQSTAAAGCEARSAEHPADGNTRRLLWPITESLT
jgi:hypothetical protein